MVKKDSVYAVYSEKAEKLELFNEDAYDERERRIEGKVFVDHYNEEIRVYNFRKDSLTNKEKVEIIYGILEESILFPNSIFSLNNTEGKMGEYTLLVNGYLLNGEYKEKNKKYDSIITELIDKTKHYDGEPECIEYYRSKIKSFYKENKNSLGKENLVLELKNTNIFKGYIYYKNMSKLLYTYLKEKRVRFKIQLDKKTFSTHRKIYILPR